VTGRRLGFYALAALLLGLVLATFSLEWTPLSALGLAAGWGLALVWLHRLAYP